MRKGQENPDINNDPRFHRAEALQAQAKGDKMIADRLASGKWEWVLVDSRTRVLKRKRSKNNEQSNNNNRIKLG